ncbi:glyoxalase [Glycomyces buryatensis]|uniref:Glyoxalase n=1 Tax=Glycomyces buryatensis TaxID=2570927 RepID=A0A4S8QGI9_9ACTN|nr:glyoxalase [Glycomyces buryatensis]THV40479.1 glyoxalase [Glycomyces buryatensis]
MTAIETVIIETPDTAAAEAFYAAAFGLGDELGFRASEAPTSGFRGFTMSLIVSQPSTVDSLHSTALEAGATEIKPATKSFWGYGSALQAPDGTIWTIASSSKKDTGLATREIDDIVILLGVDDVAATKKFYVGKGLEVSKSFGSKYVEFATADKHIKLSLYGRKAAAKNAGVSPDGSGSHRIVIRGDAGTFTDPDGFVWEAA